MKGQFKIVSPRLSLMTKFLFCLMAVFFSVSVQAYQTLIMPNHQKALVYVPVGYHSHHPIPMVMALHGMGQTMRSACDPWLEAADRLRFILVCPQGSNFARGYVRAPIDDRKRLVAVWGTMMDSYPIDLSRSLLLGFSRGGNFAIEMGLMYPNIFRNVASVFGFFMYTHDRLVNLYGPKGAYVNSRFYFYTGDGDPTYLGLMRGKRLLQAQDAEVIVQVYPHIHHKYPLDRIRLLRDILF